MANGPVGRDPHSGPGSPAVVLLSGGLGSYTAAAIAREQGFALNALTISYGQRHSRELAAARAVAKWLDVTRHIELDVNLSAFGGFFFPREMPASKDSRLD